MADLYNRTVKLDRELYEYANKHNHKVNIIWEHKFDECIKDNPQQFNNDLLVERPKLRDGFFGGRTETFKLLYYFNKLKGKVGKYIDVVSLYPSVNFYCEYPTDNPNYIHRPKEFDYNWFGMIHCRILPPRKLYIPVLPYKVKTHNASKLLFGLCRTCMHSISE